PLTIGLLARMGRGGRQAGGPGAGSKRGAASGIGERPLGAADSGGERSMLRRAGFGLLVGALLPAPSVPTAGPPLVFEPINGTVFYSEDPDVQWFPASLTKLMTAYVTFQALKAGEIKPDPKIPCSQKASAQDTRKLGLPVGGAITLDVALKVLIVKSANDVAVMIAEAVAGSQDAFI